jgi:tetratricopeptide (TPR) repeat protein
LLIGVWNYQKLPRLHSPEQDMQALSGVLRDSTIGDYEVTPLANPDQGEAQQALDEFFHGRRPAATLLVYLSGHGIRDANGAFFFSTVETDESKPKSTAVSGSFLRAHMNDCRAGTIILLVDCCHSGAILPQLEGIKGTAQPSDWGRRGRQGRAILTATRAAEGASQGPDRRLSVFTEGVVDGLATGRADPGKTGLITVHSLYDYAVDWVRRRQPDQRPNLWVLGAPVIARTPRISVGDVQPPPLDRRAETAAMTQPPPETATATDTTSRPDRVSQLRDALRRLDQFPAAPDSRSLLRQRAWIRSELGQHCDRDEALQHYEMAKADLDACLAAHPRDTVALRLRGEVLRMLGRYDLALGDLNIRVAARPDDAVALRLRGDVLRMLGRYGEALYDLDACVEMRPADAVALQVRGDVLRALGRYDEALRDLDQSLDLRPADPTSMRIRDDVRRAVDQGRVLDRLDRILDRIPGDLVALGLRARALRMAGDYERAHHDVDRLLAERPEDVGALRLRGEIRYAQADYERALSDLRKVLVHRPRDPIVEAYAHRAREAAGSRRPATRHRSP